MNRKTLVTILLPVIVTTLVAIVAFGKCNGKDSWQKDTGFIFGTSYNITYLCPDNHKADIEKVLHDIDSSLSPFNEQSVITAINNSDGSGVIVTKLLEDVITEAGKVYRDTHGAFDITVAPLVNAWGFGFKNGSMPSDTQIDSLRAFVGYDQITLSKGTLTKADPRVMLDCGAIAKGFAVDKVAEMLSSKGITDYMVEIGGEIVCRGKNPTGDKWQIGVTRPDDDSLSIDNELQTILALTDVAMATSGNYRNFYYRNGKKYAHTIDPHTGRPVQHNILSATVLAPTCMQADAYATSFMVLGLEEAQKILARHPEMMAYFIYTDAKGDYSVWHSPQMKKYITTD